MNELLKKYGLLDLTLTAFAVMFCIGMAWYFITGGTKNPTIDERNQQIFNEWKPSSTTKTQ